MLMQSYITSKNLNHPAKFPFPFEFSGKFADLKWSFLLSQSESSVSSLMTIILFAN